MESLFFNVLTLTLCLVSLYLFRKSDRSNVKLGKLQKFSKKLVEDFETLVNEKKRDFMDTSIEFDLLDKRARGLMNELTAHSQEYADQLLKLQKDVEKLHIVDNKLIQAQQLSDEVSKQVDFIAAARLQFKEDEKRIKRLGEGLAHIENESMQIVTSVEKQMAERSNTLYHGMNEHIKAFEQRINNLETSAEGVINGQIRNVVQNFTESINAMESSISETGEALLEKFTLDLKRSTQNMEQLETSITNQHREITETLRLETTSAKRRMEELEIQMTQSRDTFTAKLRDELTGFEDRIDDADRKMEQKYDSLYSEFDKSVEDFNAKIESYEEKIDNLAEDIQKSFNKKIMGVNQGIHEAIESFDRKKEDFLLSLSKDFKIMQQRNQSEEEKMAIQFEKRIEAFSAKILEIDDAFEHKRQILFDKLESSVSQQEHKMDQTERRIQDSERRMIESFNNQVKRVNEEINALNIEAVTKKDEMIQAVRNEALEAKRTMESFGSKFAEAESSFNDKIASSWNSLNEELENFKAVFKRSQHEMENEADRKIAAIYHKLSDFEQNIESSKKQMAVEASNRIEDISKKYDVKFTETDKRFDAHLNNLQNKVHSISESAETKFIEFRGRLESELNKAREQSFKVSDAFSDKGKEIISQLDDDGRNIESNLTKIWNEIRSYEKEHDLFARTDKLRQQLDEAVEFFTDSMESIKGENAELERAMSNIQDLRTIRRDIESELQIMQKKKNQIDHFEDDIKQAISLSHQVIDKAESMKEIDMRLDEANADIASVHSLLNKLKEESKELNLQKTEIRKSLEMVSNTDVNMKKLLSRLSDVTNSLEKIENKEEQLRSYLDEVNSLTLTLTNREREIQEVQRRFEQMDGLIEDIDGRYQQVSDMNKRLEKMKVWMVKSEERLEILNSRATDRIKSFAEFLDAVESSANLPMEPVTLGEHNRYNDKEDEIDKRRQKTVLKLHELGWSLDEISNKMSMQESEVDFIINSYTA